MDLPENITLSCLDPRALQEKALQGRTIVVAYHPFKQCLAHIGGFKTGLNGADYIHGFMAGPLLIEPDGWYIHNKEKEKVLFSPNHNTVLAYVMQHEGSYFCPLCSSRVVVGAFAEQVTLRDDPWNYCVVPFRVRPGVLSYCVKCGVGVYDSIASRVIRMEPAWRLNGLDARDPTHVVLPHWETLCNEYKSLSSIFIKKINGMYEERPYTGFF